MGQALEIAEDDRRQVLLRQPADFLVERRQQLDPVGGRFRGDRFASERYGPHPGALGARLGLGGDSSGHAIQPAAQRVSHPDRSSPAHQHEERRLKGVLNVVRVGQGAPADAQDHRPMPRHQGRERRLGGERGVLRRGTPGQEPIQQLRVG